MGQGATAQKCCAVLCSAAQELLIAVLCSSKTQCERGQQPCAAAARGRLLETGHVGPMCQHCLVPQCGAVQGSTRGQPWGSGAHKDGCASSGTEQLEQPRSSAGHMRAEQSRSAEQGGGTQSPRWFTMALPLPSLPVTFPPLSLPHRLTYAIFTPLLNTSVYMAMLREHEGHRRSTLSLT